MNTLRLAMMTLTAACLLGPAREAQALFGWGQKVQLPTPSAMIASVSGTVVYKAAAVDAWVPAAINQLLSPGDQVRTEADGAAVVSFSDGSKTQITKSCTFTMEGLEPRKISVGISVGSLEAWVKKLKGRRFQTRTPTAVASVRGTEFRVEVDAGGQTTWDLFGGGLDLTNNFGQTLAMDAGQRVAQDVQGTMAPPVPIPPTVTPTPEPAVPVPAPKEEAKPAAGPKPADEAAKPEPSKVKVLSFTGRLVITTADGRKIVVEPGKPIPDIPAGAKIEVEGGTAVLDVAGQAMQAGPGAKLNVTAAGATLAPDSAPVTVTAADGTTTTVTATATTEPAPTATAMTEPAATTTEPAAEETAATDTTFTEPPPLPPPNPTQETSAASQSTP